MSATMEVAKDEMQTQFKTAWDADAESTGILVLYWDRPGEPPDGTDGNGNPLPYARVTIQHVDGFQPTVGSANGKRRFRHSGFITIQIFTAFGTGGLKSDRLVKVVKDAFEGKTTASSVIFRRVSPNEIGQSGAWFQTNVVIFFEYDEVK